MGTSWILLSAALIQLGLLLCARAGPTLMSPSVNILSITRQNNGDFFYPGDVDCNPDTCVGISSGTAGSVGADSIDGSSSGSNKGGSNKHPGCVCQCHPYLPAFREDLQICVDDIHECVLAPFVSGSMSQQIPFVFLPLKGQIIHPSKEISFAGIQKPVCAVSGAKFLTEGGWIDLRNPLDADVPFRLFRDEGRTFLQWVGETELRNRMGGRLVLVHLMCREISAHTEEPAGDLSTVFTQCVAFRVVGTPAKYISNVSEVLFSADDTDHGTSPNTSTGLSLSEYVAIGVSSVLLGLIYVASVFLYLHLRRRRRDSGCKDDTNIDEGVSGREAARDSGSTYAQNASRNGGGLGNRDGVQDLAEEGGGIIKNNPLLSLRPFSSTDTGGASFSDTASSDTDNTPDIIQHHDDRRKNMQITSALIHPQYISPLTSYQHISLHQESPSIERLPEENVSIVETLECREDRPDTVKSISGTIRRKLYFNPAYFDPQLLASPPPAAVEFLIKIREVITIAKQKMVTKRFTPSLLGIPEEDSYQTTADMSEYSVGRALSSRRNSMISLKRENSRRRTCSGCPGCEPQDFKALSGKLPQFPALGACHNCASITNNESKQRSIRKWLEDVPIIKTAPISSNDESKENMVRTLQTATPPLKRLRSPARSLSPDHGNAISRNRSPRPSSEYTRKSTINSIYEQTASSVKSHGSSRKSSNGRKNRSEFMKQRAPLPPLPPNPPRVIAGNIKRQLQDEMSLYDAIAVPQVHVPKSLPPPDMIHEAMKIEEPNIPSITKRNMNAVLNEFAVQHGLEQMKPNHSNIHLKAIDYETDSLERLKEAKGYSTPTEYADVSSSQPSPSLSSALPMDEELTMHNAIINKKTGNMTISKINMDEVLAADEDDYELIILKKSENGQHCIYKLPELLQRNHGYSLVSEVYVNNGYNYGSAPSTPNDSNSSTLERIPKIIYEDNKPGHLLIEVEDCPDNYIRIDDSDNFEPDTLDRKPSKMKLYKALNDVFEDSLERPNQILLRTNGTFKSESLSSLVNKDLQSQYFKNFSSLREIYEAKLKGQSSDLYHDNLEESNFEGRILTLEERHSKRQRKSPNIAKKNIPPDVIPPSSKDITPIYEHPKPPRKVIIDADFLRKPPLPPKYARSRNSSGSITVKKVAPSIPRKDFVTKPPPPPAPVTPISTMIMNSPSSSDYETCVLRNNEMKECKHSDLSILKNFIHCDDILFKNGINQNQLILQASTISTYPKPEKINFLCKKKDLFVKQSKEFRQTMPNKKRQDDSGYLSTDSNESHVLVKRTCAGSETDESLGDGHSESGAESIETHSVFFGRYKKGGYMAGSIDSGVGSDLKPTEAVNVLDAVTVVSNNSDDDNMSYTTVVPLGSVRSRSSSHSSLTH